MGLQGWTRVNPRKIQDPKMIRISIVKSMSKNIFWTGKGRVEQRVEMVSKHSLREILLLRRLQVIMLYRYGDLPDRKLCPDFLMSTRSLLRQSVLRSKTKLLKRWIPLCLAGYVLILLSLKGFYHLAWLIGLLGRNGYQESCSQTTLDQESSGSRSQDKSGLWESSRYHF